MIRTHEELDAIINEGVEINNKRGTATMEEWQFNALIATARAAIPRPISEAPRDGTAIDLITNFGRRIANCAFYSCSAVEWVDENRDQDIRLHKGELVVSWLPIPTPEAARC